MELDIARTIKVQPVSQSRIHEIDMDNIPFGRVFSDHMLVAHYRDGAWQAPEIMPYGPLPIAPSASALNYGQAIFEGMKAHKGPMGETLLFRPEENHRRFNLSAKRMAMPTVPKEIFIEGLQELLRQDKQWIPNPDQGSLYLRPLMWASDEFIGVKASETYTFAVFCCPVGAYYSEPVNLLVNRDFIRAAPGGTGAAKFAGNYASAMLPAKLAKEQGYHNILWLDSRQQTYIEECGTMNVFFVIDDTIITPSLTGTILEGITRQSVIRLLRDNGYKLEVRPLSIFEVQGAYHEGRLQECFGAGTAAAVSLVNKIGFAGEDMILPPVEDRPVSNWLKETINGMRYGTVNDPYGWVMKVG